MVLHKRDLKVYISDKIKSQNIYISEFIKDKSISNIDFEVYLDSNSINLQTKFSWGIPKRKSLIKSIFIGRDIGSIAIIKKREGFEMYDTFQVVDGKERLLSIIYYTNNVFPVNLKGKCYYYKDLAESLKLAIDEYSINIKHISNYPLMTEEEKIKWYIHLNYPKNKTHEKHIGLLESKITK